MLPAFALTRFGLPVGVWAWPWTAFCSVFSLGLLFVIKVRPPKLPAALGGWAVLAVTVVIPAAVGGDAYIAFRSNPSDANTYMTLAESTQRAPWSLIVRVGNGGSAEEVSKLAALSPTSLYSARFTRHPMRINSMLFLAWASTICGRPVHSVYYVSSLLFVFLLATLVFTCAGVMGVSRSLKALCAFAIGLGTWTYWSTETDSISQIHVGPFLFLLFMGTSGALLALNSRRVRVFTILSSAGLTGLVLFYPEAFLFPCVTLGVIAATLWLKGGAVRKYARIVAWSVFVAITAFCLTLQIDYLYKNILFIGRFVGGGAAYGSALWEGLRRSGFAFASGVAWVPGAIPSYMQIGLPSVGRVFGAVQIFFPLAFLVVTLLRFRRLPDGRLVIPIVCVVGLTLAGFFLQRGPEYSSGKMLMWTAPFVLLLTGLSPNLLPLDLVRRRVTLGLAAITLGMSIAFFPVSLALAYADSSLFNPRGKGASFNLNAIVGAVNCRPGAKLRVDVPVGGNWPLAIHVIRTFQDRPNVSFASGLVFDNRNDKQPIIFPELVRSDFDLLLVRADDVGSAPPPVGARLIASTPELNLFEVSPVAK